MNKKIIQNAHYNTGKKLLFITLIFLFSLVFSKTTFAITLTQDVKYTNRYFNTKNGGILCENTNGQKENTNQNAGCSIFTSIDSSIMAFTTNDTLSVKQGYYYEMHFYTFARTSFKPVNWNVIIPDGWILSHYSLDYTSDNVQEDCTMWNPKYGANIDKGLICEFSPISNTTDYYLQQWTLILTPISDGNLRYGMGIRNDAALHQLFIFPAGGYIRFGDIYELAPNSDIDRAEQETQEASDEGNQNAEQAGTDNEQASTNLVGVVTKVVNAFNTPPSSSCSIPIVASGVDLGNVDFCTGKPPFWTQLVGGVGSLILVYACYRVAINMFNLFISLTVFAQGGKSKGDNG